MHTLVPLTLVVTEGVWLYNRVSGYEVLGRKSSLLQPVWCVCVGYKQWRLVRLLGNKAAYTCSVLKQSNVPQGSVSYTGQLSAYEGGGVCVESEHEAVEAGSPGGDRGKVGAHGFTSSKVTILDVHTRE